MNVVENLSTSPTTKTMFTQSFPPANALLEQIESINYQKHLRQLTTVFLVFVAVSHAVLMFMYKKTAQWYHNGGKETLIDLYHQTVKMISQGITWTLTVLIPMMQKMYQGLQKKLILLGVLVPV